MRTYRKSGSMLVSVQYAVCLILCIMVPLFCLAVSNNTLCRTEKLISKSEYSEVPLSCHLFFQICQVFALDDEFVKTLIVHILFVTISPNTRCMLHSTKCMMDVVQIFDRFICEKLWSLNVYPYFTLFH